MTSPRRLSLRNPTSDILFSHSSTSLALPERKRVFDVRGHYAFLGVEPHAAHGEIRRVGRQLAKEMHPDHGGSVEQFIKLQECLGVLLDDEARRVYDQMSVFDVYLSPLDISNIIVERRIKGDSRPHEEIIEEVGVRVVSPDSSVSPSGNNVIPSYYIEDGVAEDVGLLERIVVWNDLVVRAAQQAKWDNTIRAGVAKLTRRFDVEWRWGEPIFLLGSDVVPCERDARIAVAYAASEGDFGRMLLHLK
jgi:hypothetical protein